MNDERVIGLVARAGDGLPAPAAPVASIIRRGRRRAAVARAASVGGASLCAAAVAVAAFALTPDRDTGPAPGPAGRPAEGTRPWDQALLLPGDPSLVTVRFMAGRERPASDPCARQFTLDVDERSSQVQITVKEVPRPTPADGAAMACSLGGVWRYLTADLEQPLAGRRLLDGSDGQARTAEDLTGDAGRAAIRPDRGSGDDALLEGTLRVDAGSGCLWVEKAGKDTAVLIVGAQYSVRPVPPRPGLYPEGNLPIEAGQQLRLAGSSGTNADAVPGCPVPGAPFIGRPTPQ